MAADLEWLGDAPRPGEPRDFRIEAAGARPVTGAVWLSASPGPDTPLVLCGHGASGDRYQAPIPHLAGRLCDEYGAAVLALDGPVHGLRRVEPGGREAFAEEMRRDGFIDDMVREWHVATQAVVARTGIGARRRGYFGLSMGSIFGVPLLASDIGANVAVIGLLGSRGLGRAIGERLVDDARRIDVPVLFLMQLEDELFDRPGCLELFDALAASDKRLHANPGLHPEVPAEEVAHAVTFLGARLRADVDRAVVNPLAN